MTLDTGKVYKTRCGKKAKVCRLRVMGMDWIYDGAIEDQPGVWHMHSWTVEGYCGHGITLNDLVEEL